MERDLKLLTEMESMEIRFIYIWMVEAEEVWTPFFNKNSMYKVTIFPNRRETQVLIRIMKT